MPKPTFVCVPEHSHSSQIYEPLKLALLHHGYPTIPLTLPSVGGSPPIYDFSEDVAAVRQLVTQLVDQGKEVIVVMLGYGAIPGGEALQGLGKVEREQRGLIGGVIRLVFIMSLMAKEGFQGGQRGDVSALYPYLRPDLQVRTLLLIQQHLSITSSPRDCLF